MDAHIRDLRYVVAVAEELHFTRAAERLHVSQPALSKQIRLVERRLGTPLFARDRRRVRLTEAGEALLPHARAVLAAWDEGLAAARRAGDAASRTLVVGFLTGVGRDLQRRLAAILHPDPGPRIVLRQVRWSDPSGGLLDGTSDVAFVWLPVPEGEGLVTEPLFHEPRWVALPDGHPLAREERVAFDMLRDEPFVALPADAGAQRDHWLATAERGGTPPRIGAEASSADEAFEAVAGGVGVALLAEGNVQLYRRPGIAFRPVDGLSPSVLAVARRRDETRPDVLRYVDACLTAARGA